MEVENGRERGGRKESNAVILCFVNTAKAVCAERNVTTAAAPLQRLLSDGTTTNCGDSTFKATVLQSPVSWMRPLTQTNRILAASFTQAAFL